MIDPSTNTGPATTRRDALKLGGLSISLGAIIAACGSDRGGDDDPGRVGNAPVITEPEDLPVDDAVLLRTASSLERTAAEIYETALGLEVFESSQVPLIERLIANHLGIAEEMDELTVAAGGTTWGCTNTWILEREVQPILDAIADSDDVARDVFTLAISFENVAVSTHQSLASRLSAEDQRRSVANAAALEARHSAWLAIVNGGSEAYFSPELLGQEATLTVDGVLPQYAINSAFGLVSSVELIVGEADENDNRSRFNLNTPAENAFIYNELDPTC